MLLMVTLSSCSDDPDAQPRDRASDQTRQLAEALVLPEGYQKDAITEYRAQTPQENRGGGQGGRFIISFTPPPNTTFGQALQDFDEWARAQSYIPVEYASNNFCRSDLLSATWASRSNVIDLAFNGKTGLGNRLGIPYGIHGPVRLGESPVKPVPELPTCP